MDYGPKHDRKSRKGRKKCREDEDCNPNRCIIEVQCSDSSCCVGLTGPTGATGNTGTTGSTGERSYGS